MSVVNGLPNMHGAHSGPRFEERAESIDAEIDALVSAKQFERYQASGMPAGLCSRSFGTRAASVERDHIVFVQVAPTPDVMWRPWIGRKAHGICARLVAQDPASRTPLAPIAPAQVSIQAPLVPLQEALDRSRWMLDLPDDWDGEGSPGYTEDTWKRAARLLLGLAQESWDVLGAPLDVPKVQNGPEGSIDLHWDRSDYELLINVPAEASEAPTFYARDAHGSEIHGSLNGTRLDRWLLTWLEESRRGG